MRLAWVLLLVVLVPAAWATTTALTSAYVAPSPGLLPQARCATPAGGNVGAAIDEGGCFQFIDASHVTVRIADRSGSPIGGSVSVAYSGTPAGSGAFEAGDFCGAGSFVMPYATGLYTLTVAFAGHYMCGTPPSSGTVSLIAS